MWKSYPRVDNSENCWKTQNEKIVYSKKKNINSINNIYNKIENLSRLKLDTQKQKTIITKDKAKTQQENRIV